MIDRKSDMKKKLTFLGIETSCDETAAAIVKENNDGTGKILSNIVSSQVKEHRKFGGVVPEVAARAHVEKIEFIVKKAIKKSKLNLENLDGIAATAGPGLIVCLTVGLNTGKAIAGSLKKPFIAVNHLEGHALSPKINNKIEFPYLLLLISGGHTQFLEVNGVNNYRRLGTTIDDALGETFDKIFICASAGGGTGAGALLPLIDTAHELQQMINPNKNAGVGVILALPKASEGKKVNANAAQTLEDISNLTRTGKVSTLLLIDNEKISKLYPNLSVSKFWEAANSSLVGLFHLYNLTATKDSSYSSFDSKDYMQVLNSGLVTLSASPVKDWKDPVCISRVVRENIKNNSLCDGIDFSSGSCAGIIAIGHSSVLDNVPQSHLDSAFSQLSRILRPNSTVHIGVYSGDQNNLNIFTMVGGLEKPLLKIKQLRQAGDIR